MKKIILYPIIAVLLSLAAIANSDFTQWGGIGAVYGSIESGLSNTFLASNFPQGNYNITSNHTITVTNKFQPVIYDLSLDGKNDIFTFQNASIIQYSNTGAFVTEIVLNGSITGQGAVALDGSQLKLVVMTQTASNQYNMYELKTSGNTLIIDSREALTISKTATGGMLGGLSMYDTSKVYAVWDDNTVEQYSLNDNSFDNIGTAPYADTARALTSSLRGGQSAIRRTSQGETQLCWISKNSGTADIKITMYLVNSNVYRTATVVAGSALDNVSCIASTIGSPDGQARFTAVAFEAGQSQFNYNIFDADATQIKAIQFNDFTANQFYPVIGDINHDGNNEFCYMQNNIIHCLDGSLTSDVYNATTAGNTNYYLYWAMGEYDNSNAYSEIVGVGGIYTLNNTGFTKVYDLGLSSSIGMFMPVSVIQKATFTKDIVFASDSLIKIFQVQGELAVCGNGVCDAGETVFNCFADCGINNTNYTVGNFPALALCTNDSQCASGVCEAGLCKGKVTGDACTNDNECASGVCNDALGVCEAQGIAEATNSFFYMLGVRSVRDKILVGLIIIFLMTGIGIGYGAKIRHGYGSILGGIVGFSCSLIILTMSLGWLGVWILFFLIFMLIAGIIILNIIMPSGGGFSGG